ncbi:galactose-specific lectin nattectin-like [Hippocampus comes]|uniref:galactose-specific lectin nattectin-like n=1 Tax=Hippocampus comes TaxID=109280 RepID=UPI00094E40BE|nr:PREDICTED: galactose-specific lectin nattectin-like [Hippocampus comes]
MTFALRLLFLLYGICGLISGFWSYPMSYLKNNDCPKGWTQLDCHCYIFEDEARTFADAEAVCNILSGNLVSIHNDLENALVLELIRAGGDDSQGWIGLHDAIEDGDYIWTDGSDQNFPNFDTTNSQPDSSVGDCVVIAEDDGLWDTDACTDTNVYVCIKDVHRTHH